jgi:hypothetical protein
MTNIACGSEYGVFWWYVRAIESNSSCDVIFVSEFFFESGTDGIAPAGSRVGDGFLAICADADAHNVNSNKNVDDHTRKPEQ